MTSNGPKVLGNGIFLIMPYFLALFACLFLAACNDSGSGPVAIPKIPCEDPSVVALAGFTPSAHKHPIKLQGKFDSLSGTKWSHGNMVRDFFGGREIKLVFTLNREMYLVTWPSGEPKVTRMSHGDEGIYGGQGTINSPLFSPDGKRVVFAGTTRGKPAFIQDAMEGDAEGWRVPLDPTRAHITADPHWHSEGGKTWIYFANMAGLVVFADQCAQIPGTTYRKEVIGDTGIGPFEPTGIAGAYRGGLSQDGEWAGTSYATTALFNKQAAVTKVLAGGVQQCNPSMNPYAAGSLRSDYLMILAFGGTPYDLITGGTFVEGLHENIWIYNRNDKIVWRAARPDSTYLRWDKPEWSTDPEFATAVALHLDGEDADLYVVKIGDLSHADEDTLALAQSYLKIAEGGFNSDVYSHLWVAPKE